MLGMVQPSQTFQKYTVYWEIPDQHHLQIDVCPMKARPIPQLNFTDLANTETLAIFDLEILLVSLLLLGLPIIIYLAYRYGKQIGKKEHVSDAHYYFGPNSIKKKHSQVSSSEESNYGFHSMNSQTSSTTSSPALNPSASQQPLKEKKNINSFNLGANRKKLSPIQEDWYMKELILNGEEPVRKESPSIKSIGKSNRSSIRSPQLKISNTSLAFEEPEYHLANLRGNVSRKQSENTATLSQKEIMRKRSSFVHDTAFTKAVKSVEFGGDSPRDNPSGLFIDLDAKAFNRRERDDDMKVFPPLDVKRHVSHEIDRKTIYQGMMQGMIMKNHSELIQSKERHEPEEKGKSINQIKIESLVEKYELPDETGKFQKIFRDVEWIGEGSFGEVFKVVHRLDGKLYALKKLRLKFGRFEELKKESKVFREVFAMTDLHHLNIVRYSTCWVEIESDKSITEEKSNRFSEAYAVGLGDISENDVSEDAERSRVSDAGFEWDVSAIEEKEKEKSRKEKERQKVNKRTKESLKKKLAEKTPVARKRNPSLLIRTLSRSFMEEELEESKNSSLSKVESISEFPGCKLYLYIQMEYCAGQSLKYYLENNNKKLSREKTLNMFKKLLEGVSAIHGRGILHRDLKPANIFLDGNENVKIGDFGLALLDKFEEQFEGMVLGDKVRKIHSLKVGTPMYTSPEQEAGGQYDQKTDIYSLGLIFYEMLADFSTTHERYGQFDSIRTAHTLPEDFMKRFPDESRLILKMTEKEAAQRPNTEQLLEEVHQLLEKINSKS